MYLWSITSVCTINFNLKTSEFCNRAATNFVMTRCNMITCDMMMFFDATTSVNLISIQYSRAIIFILSDHCFWAWWKNCQNLTPINTIQHITINCEHNFSVAQENVNCCVVWRGNTTKNQLRYDLWSCQYHEKYFLLQQGKF